MLLSIIIVNYKSSAQIIDCINSAMQYSSVKLFEWIVVDNASNDNSEQDIMSRFPFVQWLPMGYNAGFARANNQGIRQSKGDVVLLLNPETLVMDDCIKTCFEKFIETDYVACGLQLYYPNGKPQISGNFFMKGGLNHLLPLPYWGKLLRTIAFAVKVKKTNVEKAATVEEVDWISGAFLMVKKTAIEKAGLMDEDFFLYAEEVEWCSRLMKHGKLCIFGEMAITHIGGQTINQVTDAEDETYEGLFDKKGLQLMVSNHVRIRKQYGTAWFLFQLLNYTIAVPIFFIGSFMEHLFKLRNPFSDFSRATGLLKNVVKVWLLAPTIISNKPHFYKMF